MDVTDLQALARSLQLPAFTIALMLFVLLDAIHNRHRTGIRHSSLRAARHVLIWLLSAATASFVLGSVAAEATLLSQQRGVGLFRLLNLPPWLATLLALLALDAMDYLFHRLSHRHRLIWLLHAVHHSDHEVDASTNLRLHPLHLLMAMGWKVLVTLALGAPLFVVILRETLATMTGSWHHSAALATPGRADRYLGWLLITPAAHRIHHSPMVSRTDSNFGAVLSIWDRLFGTYRSPLCREPRTGLDALHAPQWHTVVGMLATPWRARHFRRL